MEGSHKGRKLLTTATLAVSVLSMTACYQREVPRPVSPSLAYSDYVRAQMASPSSASPGMSQGGLSQGARARGAFDEPSRASQPPRVDLVDGDWQSFRAPPAALPPQDDGVYEYRAPQQMTRRYQGPLSYGDPGMTASLWRESRSENELFRDHRAFQPMDLITVNIRESSEGKKDANTEINQESTAGAAIVNLAGLERYIQRIAGSSADNANLVRASASNEYKGDGKTDRKGSLKGTLSAMVIEVLPSGVLRIEGEKIISVNSEEETMVLSGLVRPRDINSANEVDSSKIANLRIDYYGKGTLGETQYGGWLGRILRVVWPF